MPTPDAGDPSSPSVSPHRSRQMAESFGIDAERYDRARPPYPDSLVRRLVEASPGPDALDVGCGTGIAARQLQAAGCEVLGVEPDERMAQFARGRGVPVEVATFEAWEPAGRTFDLVVAAQSWHWIDPAAGASKAAQVLRPRGILAVFSHVYEPPAELAEPFAAAFRRAVPDSPCATMPPIRLRDAYQKGFQGVAEQIRQTGRFLEPEHWQSDWERVYTRDEWLDLLPTTGGLTRLPPGALQQILQAVGTAIDLLGGRFTMPYTTLAVTASLTDDR